MGDIVDESFHRSTFFCGAFVEEAGRDGRELVMFDHEPDLACMETIRRRTASCHAGNGDVRNSIDRDIGQ